MKLWADMARTLDLECIAPQHGAIFRGKEKVKAFGRDAMDAVETYRDAKWGGEHLDERERKAYKAFRALIEIIECVD